MALRRYSLVMIAKFQIYLVFELRVRSGVNLIFKNYNFYYRLRLNISKSFTQRYIQLKLRFSKVSYSRSLFRKSTNVSVDFLSWNKDYKEGSKRHLWRNSFFEIEKKPKIKPTKNLQKTDKKPTKTDKNRFYFYVALKNRQNPTPILVCRCPS